MKRVVEKKLKLIRICDSWGFNEKIAPKIQMILFKFNPFYVKFTIPTSFYAYFELSFSDENKNLLFDQLKDIIGNSSEYLEYSAIYFSEVTCTYDLNSKNKPSSFILHGTSIYNKSSIVFERKS